MPLNEVDRQQFRASLESVGVRDPICPFCSLRGWHLGRDVINANTMDEQGEVFVGEGKPMLPLICNNCRYVALFALEE